MKPLSFDPTGHTGLKPGANESLAGNSCFLKARAAVTEAPAQLAQLVSTNTPCRVRLQPPWTGEARQTVTTNYPRLTLPFGARGPLRESLTRRVPAELEKLQHEEIDRINDMRAARGVSAELEKLQRELSFDWFTYSDKPHFSLGNRRISKSYGDKGETFIHSYRASFPTDAQITAVATFSSLTNLLGATRGHASAWGFDGEIHTAASWALFTLKDEQTIETLSVYCTLVQARGQTERQLESIEVRRGIATRNVR